MGLVNGLQKFWRAEQKATEHRLTEHQLESFYRQISEELGMKREEREEARQFLDRMRREYDRIQLESPRLSEQQINEFRQNFPNVRNVPDIAAEEFTIVIHSVEETEKLAASQGRVELTT
jgi:uncharacterized Rossmann fold enzyme